MIHGIRSASDFAADLFPDDAAAQSYVADLFRMRDSHILDAIRARKDALRHHGTRKVLQEVIAAMSYPVPCEQCGKPVEEGRRIYAHPTCHACLPPPPAMDEVEAPAHVRVRSKVSIVHEGGYDPEESTGDSR